MRLLILSSTAQAWFTSGFYQQWYVEHTDDPLASGRRSGVAGKRRIGRRIWSTYITACKARDVAALMRVCLSCARDAAWHCSCFAGRYYSRRYQEVRGRQAGGAGLVTNARSRRAFSLMGLLRYTSVRTYLCRCDTNSFRLLSNEISFPRCVLTSHTAQSIF